MRTLLLLFTILLFTSFGFSQNSTYPDHPSTNLSSIAMEDNNIVCTGTCEMIKLSTDGGSTWEYISTPKSYYNIKNNPISNGEKYMMQSSKEVYEFDITTKQIITLVTEGFSNTWGNPRDYFYLDGNLFVLTAYVLMEKQGTNWVEVTGFELDNDDYVYSGFQKKDRLLVGTSEGKLFHVDLENRTSTLVNEFSGRISQLLFVSEDVGYLRVQGQSNPLRTVDGGLTTSSLTEMPENINYKAYGFDVFATINTNRMYISTDGGTTSQYIQTGDNVPGMSLASNATFDDMGNLFLVGRGGMVHKTEDYGNTFIDMDPLDRTSFWQIEMNSNGTGYAYGFPSSLIKTSDFGESWAPIDIPFNIESDWLTSIIPLDNNQWLMATETKTWVIENDVVVREEEEGLEAGLYDEPNGKLVTIRKINGLYRVIVSTDNGVNWAEKAVLGATEISKVSKSTTGGYYVLNYDGELKGSIDSGETWTDVEINGLSGSINDFDFYDDQLGVFSVGSNLFLTENGGANTVSIANNYAIKNIEFVGPEQIVYSYGSSNETIVRESINKGGSFQTIGSFCARTFGGTLAPDDKYWMAQEGGHINHVQIDIVTSNENITSHSSDLKLYPNPVKLGSSIKLSNDFIEGELSIYNYSGKEVFAEKITRNNQTISIQALPAGIYLTRFNSNGNTYTGKLIVN